MTAAGMAAAAPAKRGRPSTGARERILAAAMETMKSDGYAGLTVAKVSARAGESKGLITYHYGSKRGLVAAVGRQLGELITERVLAGIGGARTVEELARRIALGIEEIADEDRRTLRLYFDLAAVSVVDPKVRETISEVNERWRQVLTDVLVAAEDGPREERAPAVTILLMAGVQGMALERIERDPGPALAEARELFVRTVALAVRESAS